MNEVVHYACCIIDDPLLRENYGFLNYRKLLDLMDKYNFSTSIAFIPWNYKRTDKKIAELFLKRPDRYALCVHGCDHTKGEFGSDSSEYLDKISKLAIARMIQHEKNFGIPFERVMVFPQGIFSNEALEILKKNNYIAAVNTEPFPIKGRITSDFPLFLRYNPEDILDQTPNPLFITLHHDFFKKGYKNLIDIINKLNTINKNLKWDSVGNIINNLIINKKADIISYDMDLSGLKYHGYKESIRISLRRYASELRDNYICKNDTLFNFIRKIINPFI